MRTDGRTGGGISGGRLLSAGIQVILLAGVVGLVAGYALVPSWRDAVNGFVGSVKEMFVPSADQVYTSGPTTGPGTKEHPARLAFDRTRGFWAAPFADGSPPTIEGSFTPPADVTKILVTSGAAGDQYKSFARPRDVTLEFLDAAGTVIASKGYELKDQAEPQPFDVGAKASVARPAHGAVGLPRRGAEGARRRLRGRVLRLAGRLFADPGALIRQAPSAGATPRSASMRAYPDRALEAAAWSPARSRASTRMRQSGS